MPSCIERGRSQDNDLVTMFDHAFKQQPTSEELGAQTFFALIRIGNWKFAQQVRMPLSAIETLGNVPKLVSIWNRCQGISGEPIEPSN
jgi:hypothetical protein